MRVSTSTLLSFAVVAAPVVSSEAAGVKIKSVSLLGSGCPAGSADVQVDATGTLFEATFSEYEVQTGPLTTPTDYGKNCKLTLDMEFAPGSQSFILDTDMIGFAEIPIKGKGRCITTFSFTGNGPKHDSYSIMLPGLYSGNFNLNSHPNMSSPSPCGGNTAVLNINTSCDIAPGHLPALIAVDHISGNLSAISAVQPGSCRED